MGKHVCIWMSKKDCSLFEDVMTPKPISIHIEEVLYDQLSDITVVTFKPIRVDLVRKEVRKGPGNENHDRDTIKIAQVKVVDAALVCPIFD